MPISPDGFLSGHALGPARRVLMPVAAALGLLCALAWASIQWGTAADTAVTIPLFPGRMLHVRVWSTTFLASRTASADAGVRETFRTRWVGIWYQPGRFGPITRLLTFRLHMWPLVLGTAGVALALVVLKAWTTVHTRRSGHREID